MSAPAEALWASITRAWARPGIAPLCLRWQQDGDVDIVLLLALCHAAVVLRAPLSVPEVQALTAAMEPWRAEAVRPLRRLRMALRTPVPGVGADRQDPFRDRLKALEQEAEWVQVSLLANWLAGRDAGEADPEAGVRWFLRGVTVRDGEVEAVMGAFEGAV
ncbi:MAG: TIGR02444 family protein [Rhodobacter sp.]|nr:TIGR02444 family protein [Paracoccaceae bacterium]MCC0076887.1 TIGR02444 family protein [Rhodobacter sp.]